MSPSKSAQARPGQDTGAGPSPTLPGAAQLPRWGQRSDVEQVDLYTRGSLYFVGCFLLAMGALAAGARLGRTGPALVVVAAALVLCVSVTWWLRLAMRHRPGAPAVPWRPVLVTAAVAVGLAAWGTTLPSQTAFTVALMGAGSLGWGAGSVADTRWQWAAVAAALLLTGVATREPFLGMYGAACAGFFLFTTRSSLWLLDVVTELDRARGTQAALAVAEERLRFSRDVHDVLGRHLSTIAVQAELAATLAGRGDGRAGEKVLEVRASAHEALREARTLARGYRPLDLGQELDGAVALLRSAGIEARADLAGLPEAWHEPVARVVREAVTNVLRHSDASHVEIVRAGDEVTVRDDGSAGSQRPGGSGDGTGLDTLREELRPLGAVLEAGPGRDGFEVRVRLGAARPVPAEAHA